MTDTPLDFNGQVGLVTGAAGGLGLAYTRLLARLGARIVMQDVGADRDGEGRDPERVASAAARLRVDGEGFHSHVMRQCVAAGFMPKVVQEAHGMHAVLSLVAVETGIAIVPSSMAGFRDTEVSYRPVQSEDAHFSLSFCLRTDMDNPALHAFMGMARSG